MRSIDYLVQLFPDKTGKELLEIQNRDKADDEKQFRKIHDVKLRTIEDINTNGGFYKGTFGLSQCFYYSFKNLKLIEGKIYCDVEDIVCFFEGWKVSIEIRDHTYKEFENYGVDIYEKITESDYKEALKYVFAFQNFWNKS